MVRPVGFRGEFKSCEAQRGFYISQKWHWETVCGKTDRIKKPGCASGRKLFMVLGSDVCYTCGTVWTVSVGINVGSLIVFLLSLQVSESQVWCSYLESQHSRSWERMILRFKARLIVYWVRGQFEQQSGTLSEKQGLGRWLCGQNASMTAEIEIPALKCMTGGHVGLGLPVILTLRWRHVIRGRSWLSKLAELENSGYKQETLLWYGTWRAIEESTWCQPLASTCISHTHTKTLRSFRELKNINLVLEPLLTCI